MELVNSKLNIKFNGSSYELSEPTLGLMKEYESVFKEIEKGAEGSIDKIQDFLSKLGLPMDVSNELSIGNLNKVVTAVVSQKKA